MRKSTFNYIKDILADYPETDEHIRKREEELRYPYRESDINRDIKGTKASYDSQDNLMITIEQDKRLAALERNKRVIDNVLQGAGEDTMTIIFELYMKKYPRYTMQGLIDNNMVYCSRATAFTLRNEFFKEIALDLGLDI
ncbi:transcriptional regulator [Enterococcus sp. BWR-S5]|uniref:transcriptional regulator n=1 Tax=Enterococcus sp. BWR-S5 TaxID=2787714 RepID=UPI001922CA75|nr:transcriptional regulator [Enterococcus sp. BWR-S5]MBL1225386.1 transcriptional regulator [Enterococcus sp. BWR-S5]